MKYCTHCGNQLVDEAVICPQCGCAAENYGQYSAPYGQQPQSQPRTKSLSALSLVGFILAFVIPLAGLICSIIGYKNAINDLDDRSKGFSKAGIIISAVFIGIEILVFILNIVFYSIGLIAWGGGYYY